MKSLAALALATLASTALGATASCPFQPTERNQDPLTRAQTNLKNLEELCQGPAASRIQEAFSKFNRLLSVIREKMAAHKAIPQTIVGNWPDPAISCGNYISALTTQRVESLRRLDLHLSPPQDGDFNTCFQEKRADIEKAGCIQTHANERLHAAARFCKDHRTHSQQLQQWMALQYKSVDNAMADVLTRMPSECDDFKNHSSALYETTAKAAANLSAAFATMQSAAPATATGMILGASLLQRATNPGMQTIKSIPQFKKSMQLPSKLCMLYELQQKELSCDQTAHDAKSALSPSQSATPPQSQRAAVQELLNAMKATDAPVTPHDTSTNRYARILENLESVLGSVIPNPFAGTTPARNPAKRNMRSRETDSVETAQYLARVAQDLEKASSFPTFKKEEQKALARMAANISSFINTYSKYAARISEDDSLKKELLTVLAPLTKAVWNKEVYENHPAAGLREALDRHMEIFHTQSAGLNDLRRLEYSQSLLQPIDDLPGVTDTQTIENFMSMRDDYMDEALEVLSQQWIKLEELQKFYSEKKSAGITFPMANYRTDFRQVVKPLLKTCALLVASFHFARDSYEIEASSHSKQYRTACSVFECGGKGLPLFDISRAKNPKQELHALQCGISAEYESKWEKFFESNFSSTGAPGQLCANGNKPTDSFPKILRKMLPFQHTPVVK